MIYFTVYFSGYVKSIFVLYEVISELYSVIMMAPVDLIIVICLYYSEFWMLTTFRSKRLVSAFAYSCKKHY